MKCQGRYLISCQWADSPYIRHANIRDFELQLGINIPQDKLASWNRSQVSGNLNNGHLMAILLCCNSCSGAARYSLERESLKNAWNNLWSDLEGEKDFNDDHREEITVFVQSIPRFQESDEENAETWMACDAEDCGFQMLNDDEIVTSENFEKNSTLSTMKQMKTRITTTTKVARVHQMLTRFLR
ncbi:uncharacterized protein TNCV_3790611 [Trichonephila clavipes]|nr:uncharacterized protein TNCV_3790611 [Trichonephila clavipes]